MKKFKFLLWEFKKHCEIPLIILHRKTRYKSIWCRSLIWWLMKLLLGLLTPPRIPKICFYCKLYKCIDGVDVHSDILMTPGMLLESI